MRNSDFMGGAMRYYLLRHVDQTKSPECGCAMLNPGWCHMRRRLESETVLIIGRKGVTVLCDDGEALEVKPGRAVLLPAGHVHQGLAPVSAPVSYYWIHFSQRLDLDGEQRVFLPKAVEPKDAEALFVDEREAFEKLQDSVVLPQLLDVHSQAAVNNLCAEILHEYAKPSFSPLVYRELVIRLLLELYGDCFRSAKKNIDESNGSQPQQPLVRQVLLLLEDELSNPNASVKFFADRLKVNADYLGRCFKDAMHISVGQFIGQRRVELACARLRETSDDIETVAAHCGFGSRRQFYDEFKRRTGKTPANYRTQSAYIGVNSL